MLKEKIEVVEFCKINFKKCFKKIEHMVANDLVGRKCKKCFNEHIYKIKKDKKIICCINPDCDYVQNETDEKKLLEFECLFCKAPLLEKVNKNNKKFIACSGFPKCKYTGPLDSKGKKCEGCGEYLFWHKTKKASFMDCKNCNYMKDLYFKKRKT